MDAMYQVTLTTRPRKKYPRGEQFWLVTASSNMVEIVEAFCREYGFEYDDVIGVSMDGGDECFIKVHGSHRL